ncbi:type II secretion system protein GspC [Thalassotalea sp. 1_MG-2023]|uniref:type II secretion system protein GspC n=1 Tax=Thalassotalea sp. 1_MG-2023 TaxID=3062680 RepID=UPI0026E31645|nr:type II secretion system protein GspC [Thalassotalea sp. 1_MG-2023]MDO6425701.1 type II secretion system protein GspC [Thalassotalea sp. 1_MG-2023]
MRISTELSSLQQFIRQVPQKKVAFIISAILLCYIAYILAQFTWQLLPSNEHINSTAVTNVNDVQQQKALLDLSALKQLNLFGAKEAAVEQVPVKVQDAPETQLRLTLTGTVASSDQNTAAAIIENNGKQETYGIGDKISGTRATLESVATDRVIIKQSGRLETLMLDGFKYSKVNTSTVNKRTEPIQVVSNHINTVDQRENDALSETAMQLQQDINTDPGKIFDYLKVSPKRQNGDIIGYQLMPGKEPEFFRASGLKSGDVAVQMNGYDLTLPSEAAQAVQALKEETEISLLVNRNGSLTEILFSIQ